MFTKSFESWLEQHNLYTPYYGAEELKAAIVPHLERGTGIGKILKKLKWRGALLVEHCHNLDKIIQEGVIAFNAMEYVPNVEITGDKDVIEDAYRNILSCMTNGATQVAEFLTHYELVDQGIRLATYTHRSEVVGRAIVNIRTKGMCGVYSKISELEFCTALDEMGYLPAEYAGGVFVGCKLPWITWDMYLDEAACKYRLKGEDWWFISTIDCMSVEMKEENECADADLFTLNDPGLMRGIADVAEETGIIIDPLELEYFNKDSDKWRSVIRQTGE
jgi:hypothetical protein